MKYEEIKSATDAYNVNIYSKFPVAFQSGWGTKLYDTEGKQYTDFLAGIAVNALGYSDPELVQAVAAQAAKVMHVSNLFYSEPQAELLKLLLEGSGFSRGFLCNSGAEANEAAAKLARKYFYDRGEDRYEFITFSGSFHGRTLLTATLTGQEKYSKPFAPLPPGVRYVTAGNSDELATAFTPHTAAFLLEVVQGEGGVLPVPKEYLLEVQRQCRARGVLLIVDEIQTGLGRTGTMFAFEHFGLTPDIVTLAKALGGGLPLGAMLAKEEVASAFAPGNHGTTFGGNPVACAAARVVLRRLKETDLLARVARTGAFFREGLEALHASLPAATASPRGLGLLLGLPLADCVQGRAVVETMLERGFIINCAAHNTLRFAPPLIITEEEIADMLSALSAVIKENIA